MTNRRQPYTPLCYCPDCKDISKVQKIKFETHHCLNETQDILEYNIYELNNLLDEEGVIEDLIEVKKSLKEIKTKIRKKDLNNDFNRFKIALQNGSYTYYKFKHHSKKIELLFNRIYCYYHNKYIVPLIKGCNNLEIIINEMIEKGHVHNFVYINNVNYVMDYRINKAIERLDNAFMPTTIHRILNHNNLCMCSIKFLYKFSNPDVSEFPNHYRRIIKYDLVLDILDKKIPEKGIQNMILSYLYTI